MNVSITVRHQAILVASHAVAVGVWTAPSIAQCEAQTLRPIPIVEADQFGDAVAIDGGWAVVGASRNDALGSASGAAFVFEREPEGTWIHRTALFASDGSMNDLFGWSVAIDDDVIVVGAYLDDHLASNAGAVYVYRWDGSAWVEQQKLTASDAATGDEFGEAVAIHGDLIVVGAARDDDGATNTGSVYVFRWNGIAWIEEAKLVAPDAGEQDRFGQSVAVRDGTVVGGAALSDHAGLNSGAVFLFEDTGADWTPGVMVIALDASAGAKFGEAVAIDADLLVVGAHLDDEVAANAGAAYVFRWLGGTWVEEAKLVAEFDGGSDDAFGRTVAVTGDDGPDGDIVGDIVLVGAPLADVVGVDSGTAYLFSNAGGDWFEQGRMLAGDAGSLDLCATAVDLDGPIAIVGASHHDDAGAENAGTAYLFTTAFGPCSDCDDSGVLDHLEIASDGALDCNENGVLDTCEIDEDSEAIGGPFYCTEGCDPDCNDNGVPDACDIDSGASIDSDGNGVPDECEDCDGDDVPDDVEIAADPALDCDGNGRLDACDVADGVGADCNDNGVLDTCEIDVDSTAPGGPFFCTDVCAHDCNGNGVPDTCDIEDGSSSDCNDSGVPDSCEIASDPQLDLNDNGVLDSCEDCDDSGLPDFVEIAIDPDLDCDGNGVLDVCDIPVDSPAAGGPFYCTAGCDADCNTNGVPDACDVADGVSADLNGNGIPDECEDCNGNGVLDDFDIDDGTSADCNDNGLPDECEISVGSVAPGGPFHCTESCDVDCNANGVPDACDVADGSSVDCDDNGVPDECEDCDDNGLGDACEIAANPNLDLNDNGVLDTCDPDCDDDGLADFLEIALAIAEDCDDNGVPDLCDIAVGSSAPGGPFYCTEGCDPDCNDNGVPDACDIASGTSLDVDPPDGWPDECPVRPDCAADLDGSGDVGFTDLLAVLSTWGACPLEGACDADLDGSGDTGFTDLLAVLSDWGDCS